jgi:hypothetical protein
MKVKIITYQRVKNLGNYESERLEMVAELSDVENALFAAEALKAEVNAVLFPVVEEEEGEDPIPFDPEF